MKENEALSGITAVAVIIVAIVAMYGYINNIFQLYEMHASGDFKVTQIPLFVAKIFGVLIPPLGALLGIL